MTMTNFLRFELTFDILGAWFRFVLIGFLVTFIYKPENIHFLVALSVLHTKWISSVCRQHDLFLECHECGNKNEMPFYKIEVPEWSFRFRMTREYNGEWTRPIGRRLKPIRLKCVKVAMTLFGSTFSPRFRNCQKISGRSKNSTMKGCQTEFWHDAIITHVVRGS